MSKNGKWVKVTDLSTLKVGDSVKYCNIVKYRNIDIETYWYGDTENGNVERVVGKITPTEINVYEPDCDVLMSNLIRDGWDEVYKWVEEKDTPNVVTPEIVEPKPSKKIATIYIYESGDRYDWTIRFPIKVGHSFSSDKFYTKRNDALRAAKNVCEQMGIKYTVSEE